MLAVIDTHALIRYLYDDPRLSQTARDLLNQAAATGDQVACSALTLAEVLYLVEKERIAGEAFDRLLAELEKNGSILTVLPVDLSVIKAMRSIPRNEVPDLPDRVIAATAHNLNVPLISRDRKIVLSSVPTVW